jgi:hypothetical protein
MAVMLKNSVVSNHQYIKIVQIHNSLKAILSNKNFEVKENSVFTKR